jgi:uncharacterized protein involved in exopolysaccharide biosynthesis
MDRSRVLSDQVTNGVVTRSSPIVDSMALVLRHRRILAAAALVGLVAGLLIALLRPPSFTTTFSFVPQSDADGSRSGLANLAGQFGVTLSNVGQATSPQLYVDLLATRELLAPIAMDTVPSGEGVPTPVASLLRVREGDRNVRIDETVRRLKNDVIATQVAARTTGLVTVDVRTRSAGASLAIAKALVAGLTRFNVETRQSQATAERKFVEGRLSAAAADLDHREDSLRRFLDANRAMSNSPTLQFEQDRLRREITAQQGLTESLRQQFEEAKIREVRDTPVITLIEHPALAARPDSRGRARIIFGATSIGLLVALSILLVNDRLQRELADHDVPSFAALAQPQPPKSRQSA